MNTKERCHLKQRPNGVADFERSTLRTADASAGNYIAHFTVSPKRSQYFGGHSG